MAQIIDEIRGLYELYPAWLVTACLSIVGIGLGYALWKLIRIGLVVVVTALLICIVAFAGWMILAS